VLSWFYEGFSRKTHEDFWIIVLLMHIYSKKVIAGFSILPFYIHGHTSHFSYYADYSMHRCDTTFCIIRIAFADIFMPLYSYALKCLTLKDKAALNVVLKRLSLKIIPPVPCHMHV